jgi:predicted metalloprotease
MRWRDSRRSENVEDRRGRRVKQVFGGGLTTILLIAGAMYLGIDPSAIIQQQTQQSSQIENYSEAEQVQSEFAKVVLAETEDVWNRVFAEQGMRYVEPAMVLFSGEVSSACGYANAASGPFYCPGDQKVYIDVSFFDELAQRHGAGGDFAAAYVLAHEIGHHVQNVLGITPQVQQQQARSSKRDANALSVRLELQADCLAGVWANRAHRTKGILEEGDIDEALVAANSIGDDRLQKEARGYVVPDSFTHGSSKQRMFWFTRGLKGGTIDSCDTFSAVE